MEALLQKVARFRAQELAKRDVFLTEAEAYYQPRRVEESVKKPEVQATTYESLIREVDSIQQPKYTDDLAELRQTIKRCRTGINQHMASSKVLGKQVQSLRKKSLGIQGSVPARQPSRTLSTAKSTGLRILKGVRRV
jgi:hypothetical protein